MREGQFINTVSSCFLFELDSLLYLLFQLKPLYFECQPFLKHNSFTVIVYLGKYFLASLSG